MKSVEIYIPICGYCVRAKALLKRKGVKYVETDVLRNPKKKEEMIRRSNGRTVPQIFIDGKSIGGCDELYALERSGQLDKKLGVK